MFDSRMAGDVPRTKVSAWLSRVESALELHCGLLKNIPCDRLLRVVLLVVDDHTKTLVHTTLGKRVTWAEFKLALSKRSGLTKRKVKMRLWEC